MRPEVVEELLPLLPAHERREILRLRDYPEDSAGAMMTTEVAMIDEELTVRQAIDELSREAERLETIYYIYAVDHDQRLDGVVTARKLLTALKKPDMRVADLMETRPDLRQRQGRPRRSHQPRRQVRPARDSRRR